VIQDVILTPPLDERARTGEPAREYGTMIRAYDSKTDTWRVTFEAPVHGSAVHLTARAVGDEIWLEGPSPDGSPGPGSSPNVSTTRSRERGYESPDKGDTWILGEEIHGRRRSA